MLLRRYHSRREFPKQEAKQPPVEETPAVEEIQTPAVEQPPVKRNRRKKDDAQ